MLINPQFILWQRNVHFNCCCLSNNSNIWYQLKLWYVLTCQYLIFRLKYFSLSNNPNVFSKDFLFLFPPFVNCGMLSILYLCWFNLFIMFLLLFSASRNELQQTEVLLVIVTWTFYLEDLLWRPEYVHRSTMLVCAVNTYMSK